MFWLEGHIEAWWTNGEDLVPVIVLGAVDATKLLVCRGDTGDLTMVPLDKVKLGWRYDTEAGVWVDIDHPAEEVTDGDPADLQG